MNTTKNNIFYIDRSIESILSSPKRSYDNRFRISNVGNSILFSDTSGPEKRVILFKPEESLFTYEVNGHFFGKYYYTDDKIIAKWPNKINEKERKSLVKELQLIFRGLS